MTGELRTIMVLNLQPFKNVKMNGVLKYIGIILAVLLPNISAGEELHFSENREYRDVPAEHALIQSTDTRIAVDLCGEWEYRHRNDAWRPVWIPSSYTEQTEVVFRRSFQVSDSLLNRHIRLVAYGINYQCSILVNGQNIGTHTGGYTKFSIDISRRILRSGANVIEIHVDNRLNPASTIPPAHPFKPWINYGGIYREIYLEALPSTAIEQVKARINWVEDLAHATVEVEAQFRNYELLRQMQETSVEIENILRIEYAAYIVHRTTGFVIARFRSGIVDFHRTLAQRFSLECPAPRLWSVNTPDMYMLVVELYEEGVKRDGIRIPMGFSRVMLEEQQLFVNAERQFILGIRYFEDHPMLGQSMNWTMLERDILLMKELGANTIVVNHYIPHPYLLKLCNMYGLYLIEGMPLWHQLPSEQNTENLKLLATNMAVEMVDRDRFQPCVLAWGIGFAFHYDNTERSKIFEAVRAELRTQDDRLTLIGMGQQSDRVSDFSEDILLVSKKAGMEYDLDMSVFHSHRNAKLLTLVGYGRDVFSDKINKPDQAYFVESQIKALEQNFYPLRSVQNIGGIVYQSFADWRTNIFNLQNPSGYSLRMCAEGVVDYQRRERLSFSYLKTIFQQDVNQPVHHYTEEASRPFIYQVIGLIILIVITLQYRRSSRFGENFHRALFFLPAFFADFSRRRLLPAGQTIFLLLLESAILASTFSALLYYYRRNVDLNTVMTLLCPAPVMKLFNYLMWRPEEAIVVGGLIILGIILCCAVFMYMATLLWIRWITLYHILQVVVWSGSMLIVLIPVVMVAYPALAYGGVVWILLFILLLISLWWWYRIISGYTVISKLPKNLVHGTALLLFLIGCIGYLWYIQYAHRSLSYLVYYF